VPLTFRNLKIKYPKQTLKKCEVEIGRMMVKEAESGSGRELGKEEVWVKGSDWRHHRAV
jgi:hypothetical protein